MGTDDVGGGTVPLRQQAIGGALLSVWQRIPEGASVFLGGSYGTTRETLTSDLDVFVIGEGGDYESYLARLQSHRIVDVETLSSSAFRIVRSQVENFVPDFSAELPSAPYDELRFLVRSLLGQIVQDCHLGDTTQLVEGARLVLAARAAAFYCNIFQDIYGLWCSGRYDDVVVRAGEITQWACMLALCQSQLVDPAPKWAPTLACADSLQVGRAAQRLMQHLSQFRDGTGQHWTMTLLHRTNAVVAAAQLAARHKVVDAGARLGSAASDYWSDPSICLIGVPGYLAVMDVREQTVTIGNEPLLSCMVIP